MLYPTDINLLLDAIRFKHGKAFDTATILKYVNHTAYPGRGKGILMRLYLKIYLSIVVMLVVILGIDGYLSIDQEVKTFNHDMKTDLLLLGHALSGMVEHTWKQSGENKTIALINNANRKEHSIKIRWVWLDNSATAPYLPQAPLTMLNQVIRGKDVSFTMKANCCPVTSQSSSTSLFQIYACPDQAG